MDFEIPTNLERFSLQGLREVAQEAVAARDTLIASVTPETVTDEQLADLSALKDFVLKANDFIKAAEDKAAEFAAATTAIEVIPATKTTTTGADVQVQVGEVVAPVHSHTAPEGSALSALRISDLEPQDLTRERDEPGERPLYATMVAAADVPGVPAGQELDLMGFAKAFEARTAGYRSLGRLDHTVSHGVAVITRDYPAELSVWNNEGDQAVLSNVIDEKRLPGGSLLESWQMRYEELQANKNPNALTAASGWCAPSETVYTICSQVTTDGLADFPEVQARRGGVRHNSGLDFGDIFGNGSGFFNLTEAQVAAGVEKSCLEIPCIDFVDERLGVTGVCLTGNILAVRGYPEMTATFTSGAMAVSAHQINALQIAAVATGSTAVDLSAQQPWASDGTVASNLLSAVEMAIVDIKYNLRLMRSATLEVILPYWVLAQFRADFSRRTGGDSIGNLSLTDSQIVSWFATRGARVQFVYDWQDAFSDSVTANSPGSATPINNLPTTTDFIVYPAGTWVRAVSDVITLNAVYDSTLLPFNQFTHLFTETGWKMLKMCPVSRVYTVPTCPSGETTSTQSITCPS